MTYMQSNNFSDTMRVAVIGGGAAGMMAAGTAVLYGAEVTIFESMKFLGKKLGITGKGRCNVTNNSEIQEFLENVPKNPRFLYTALNSLSPRDTMAHFESLGVTLKTERGRRVFPENDKAKTIVDAMRSYCSGADTVYEKVKRVIKTDGGFTVKTAEGEYTFDKVIIATGGKSYPLTGSDGSGYKLATSLGHTVTALTPSLIPLESEDKICPELQGLSLKNVEIKILDKDNKILYTDFGEMMFTHFGVTGPVILSASSHLVGKDISELTLSIDLKPALDDKTLDQRLLSDFSKNANRDFINSLSDLLPSKLIEPFVSLTGIDPHKKVNSVTKEERRKILELLKGFKISLSGVRPIEEAIITSGGVDVKEISPKTMESKLVSGLYFAGEIIDVDAYTGGYNLQIAFSTGYLAGLNSSIS
ncbi:MAG: NAD(P)/FAD-dependent oxidoreductase [Clostridia bacterium]|nr:NAD(P)/FAD-dependent oxidoreductase [Clostridia bacterium]